MANPKAQTIQQRFGFADEDLKSSSHDEIMFWLDKNIEIFYREITGYQDEWDINRVKEITQRYKNLLLNEREENKKCIDTLQERISSLGEMFVKKPDKWIPEDIERSKNKIAEHRAKIILLDGELLKEPVIPKKPILDIEKMWEYAIKSDRFIVGFIDMQISAEKYTLEIANIEHDTFRNRESLKDGKLPEIIISTYGIRKINFEVKSSIPSLGELIRQIRMYEEYEDHTFYVIAPDNKFANQLCSQSIGFIQYPTGQIYKP